MLALDGTKLSLHEERLQAFLAGERIAPITIDMALTQKCQAACVFCYGSLQRNPSDAIPWRIWDIFLRDCVRIGHKKGEGVKAISLVSDGESTLSKSYYPFIYKAKDLGIDIASGTNGEALKKEEMPKLLECLTYLRINLNAANRTANARIMGTTEKFFQRVVINISRLVELKYKTGSKTSLGLQMVLMPSYADEVLPLAELAKSLGVDYLVIKHCSDDERGSLGVDYAWYRSDAAVKLLKEAEERSTEDFKVIVKWSKIRTGRDREYSRCYATPLHLQISGSGLVAPCGSFFSPRYSRYHIGDLGLTRFKNIWKSERYWEVMNYLASKDFDARTQCATLCLQDRTNLALSNLIEKGIPLPQTPKTVHGPNFL